MATMPDAEIMAALPSQQRGLELVPGSFNAEARTVDVVFTTGARRAMFRWRGWDGEWVDEELSTDPKHVRMDRINSGGPVLNAHRSWTLENQIGVVVAGSARMEKGRGVATLQLSAREELKGLMDDIAAGITRNISVGYIVHRYEITEKDGERPLYRAMDWEPHEISFVPIPADAGAGSRSMEAEQGGEFPCIIRRDVAANKEARMADVEKPAGAAPAPEVVTPPEQQRGQDLPPASSGLKASEIINAVRDAKLPADFANDLIARNETAPMTREAMFEAIVKRFGEQDTPERGGNRQSDTIIMGTDERTKLRLAAETALLHRFSPREYRLENGAERFRGLSLLEMGSEMLAANGVSVRGLSRGERAAAILNVRDGGMHSTSDFPMILANVAGKTLRAAYDAAPQTYSPFVRAVTVPDFKEVSRVQLGDAPDLDKVGEGGEFKRGTFGEAQEKYSILTYGKVVAVTRQAIINDDLDAFSRLPQMFGRAAADKISDLVYGIFSANAAMGDTVALFHATHGNLAGSGGAINTTTLSAARAAMRKQKGLGDRFISVQPEYLIVGPDKETEAQQVLASITATKSTDVNPFQGSLKLIVEPRITGNVWYLASSPSQIDTIELAALEGQEGVYLESRVGFDVDGMELKVRIDAGAKAIDWRGLYKNPGA